MSDILKAIIIIAAFIAGFVLCIMCVIAVIDSNMPAFQKVVTVILLVCGMGTTGSTAVINKRK